ncbi:UPF0481 protein At3g47200 [Ricinus communis]|uniref:Uncharacterized protein n=1 Tax=Ricinus communis TaxID=3988 RepID=B9RZP9_RICCO|nr:UPF0481 protein At3g47200 [Ricinus communis]EEF43082.1 conserved hypothetical protein [Ricinus communis]|eukprot:XP_025013139.1 UPF0481 protein At3g47200 [Ricinus communis]
MEREQIRMLDQVSVDIRQPDDDLVISIRNEMERISYLHCICKVKDSLLGTNGSKSYIPDQVSVGPYHHEEDGLAVTEEQKWQYVHVLLSRKPNLEASLDACVTALKEVEHRARSCYAGGIDDRDWPSNKFLTMMLVDGCFIIELLLKYSIKSLRRRNDKIFTTPGMLFDVRCNLILLENQIPLFILQRLFQVVPIPRQCIYTFAELCFRFFRNMIPGDPQINREKFSQEAHHLLDIICHCLLPTYPRVLPPKESNSGNKPLPSATKLQDAGIRIKKARKLNLLDIKFDKGVLEIPPIVIHQYTETLLKNLIALEQCSSHVQYITSYAFFMKWLISEDKDVTLLKKIGILINCDAIDEKEVKKVFDKLDEANFPVKEFYHDGLREQVNSYKGTRKWRQWRERQRHRNPQLCSVLVVAVLALFIALLGTLFSVLSFSLHRSNTS